MSGALPPWQRVLTTWGVPVVVGLAFLGLVRTAHLNGLVQVLVLLVMAAVAMLWFMFLEMSVHAALSRAAAIGDADEVSRRAAEQVGRRWSAKSRMPFILYEAVGHELRGDWTAALVALDRARPNLGPPTSPWGLVAARTEIAAQLALGKPEAARAAYVASFGAARARPGSPAELFAREGLAKLQLADGDPAAALPTFVALGRDGRLGPAARAVALVHAARCQTALGDAATAATTLASARGLAPGMWTAQA